MTRNSLTVLMFAIVIKETKRIILLKTAKHPVRLKVMSIYLMQRPFSVHKSSPLDFNRFYYTALFYDVKDDFSFYI